MKKISSKKEQEFEFLYISLIGYFVEIIESKNPLLLGKKGRIIFESANLLYLEQKGSIIKIPKSQVSFNIDYKGKALYMDGCLLFSTTINRIKKLK